MKKLLVPTDFSSHADAALDYAIEIANRFGSALTLLHLYQVFSTSGTFLSVENYMKEDLSRRLLHLLRAAEARLQRGARIDSRIGRGETAPLIAETAEAGDYDLIIMGTQGASGLQDIFLGSTTASVLRRTNTPVLAIPRAASYHPLRRIVLALDEAGPANAAVLQPLLQLAGRFGAHLHVYHKDQGKADDGIDPAIEQFLGAIEHSYHYELDQDRLSQSINDFVADVDADLLCMIRRPRGFLDTIFRASATTREVFHTAVPLLVLHDPAR